MTTVFTAPSSLAGCRLESVDGHALPLRAVDLTVRAGGGLARVRVRQQFANPLDRALAVTYQLPLPADGAVVDFAFVVAGQRVVGRVERTADARATFERAVMEGRTAALLEQQRSSVFSQQLGNVPPGAVVEVEIDVEQPLSWRDGGWEWRFPTVVAPRFLGEGTPDPAAVAVPVASGGPGVVCRVAVSVDDEVTGALVSPSHPLRHDGEASVLVGLLDRDAVVRWPVARAEPEVRLEAARNEVGDLAHGLVTVVPPIPSTEAARVPRDVILLLDTSGSMNGVPLRQLQAVSRGVIRGLRRGDRLEIVEFSRQARRWTPDAVSIDEGTRADALRFVDGLRASGGTHMHAGIEEALRPLRTEALRQVILVTDGLIGHESRVVGHIVQHLPAGCRVHTVGIGSAPNRSLTGPAARAGGGFEAIIGPEDDAAPVIAELLLRTDEPLLVDLTVSGSAVLDVAPRWVADVFAGCPARLAVRLQPSGGEVVVTGRTAHGSFQRTLSVGALAPGRRVLATRYAREKVEDLELLVAAGEDRGPLDAQIEALGLAYRIATRKTSWVAATGHATVDPGEPTVHQVVPQAMPHAMSAHAVGLRPAMSPARPSMPRRRLRGGVQSVRGEGAPQGPRRAMRKRSRRLSASQAPPPAVPVAPDAGAAGPRRRVRAVVRSTAGGILVLEVDGPVPWDATGPVRLTLPDGRSASVEAHKGTTRPCDLARGQQARLCLAWTGPVPTLVHLGHLVLEIEP